MADALPGGRAWDAWALSLNAFAALLVSPISWSHHWVWGETGMLALVCLSLREQRPNRRRWGLALASAGIAAFAVAPQWMLPHGGNAEVRWAAWEQIAGSSYVILAVAVLLAGAAGYAADRRGRARGTDGRTPDEPASGRIEPDRTGADGTPSADRVSGGLSAADRRPGTPATLESSAGGLAGS
jgi:hypothetical protein